MNNTLSGLRHFIVVILFAHFLMVGESKKCHTFFENHSYPLGTKTPYSYVSNNVDEPLVFEGKFLPVPKLIT